MGPQAWLPLWLFGGVFLAGASVIRRRRKAEARRQKRARRHSAEGRLEQFLARNPDLSRLPGMQEVTEKLQERDICERMSGRRAPQPGEVAPDFSLLPLGAGNPPTGGPAGGAGRTRVSLADFKGHQPVVLIFGSYT